MYSAERIFDKAQASYETAYKYNKTNPLIVSGAVNRGMESHNLDLAKLGWIAQMRG